MASNLGRFTLSNEDYAVLTRALTEYADELEFKANDPAEAHNAASFREDVDRTRRIVDVVEQALDES